jgi:hypothetical protein
MIDYSKFTACAFDLTGAKVDFRMRSSLLVKCVHNSTPKKMRLLLVRFLQTLLGPIGDRICGDRVYSL